MARASLIAPAVARRLDRLSRQVHAFHRFAHHPLCTEYAGEIVRIGRRAHGHRICKGCAMVAIGLFVGAVIGVVLPPLGVPTFAVLTPIILLAPTLRKRPLGTAWC